MAAGRVDVTRREDVIYRSDRKSVYCRNGFRDLELKRRDFIRRDEGRRVVGENGGKNRYTVSRFEDEEPRAKRTKFSPNCVGEEVRISSENRIVKKRSPISCLSPSPPKSCVTFSNFIVDDLSKSIQDKKISPVESRLGDGSESDGLANSPSLLYSEVCNDNNEEDEKAEVQPISRSRWAYEEVSPLEKRSSNDGSISSRGRVDVDTPESGEICENSMYLDPAKGAKGSELSNGEVDRFDSMESCLDTEMENNDASLNPEG